MVQHWYLPDKDPNAVGYWADQPLHKKFLENKQFCSHLQNYLENFLSTKIAITLQKFRIKGDNKWSETITVGFMIEVKDEHVNKKDMGYAVSDFCRNYFEKMTTKYIKDENVQSWLAHSPTRSRYFLCIKYITETRASNLFILWKMMGRSLKISYVIKEPFTIFENQELDQIFRNEILHEVIWLSSPSDQLPEYRAEIFKIRAEFASENDVVFNFAFAMTSPTNIKYKVTLFGYFQRVNQIKAQILQINKRQRVIEPKLNLMIISQMETLLEQCPFEIHDINKEYKDITSDLCLRMNVPDLVEREEYRSYIERLVSKLKAVTFQGVSLPKDIAEKAKKHLYKIAHRNHCYIKTELIYRIQHNFVPKSTSPISYASNYIKELSTQFCSSSDVITKVAIASGSIEVHTGDISQKHVDIIIISSTPDGLQEGLIERAGPFTYRQTYTDVTGTKITKTDGGNLNCKRILFCNGISLTDIENEYELRKTIQVFVATSIEYAMKDENLKSIAIATPDLGAHEKILAEELIGEAKRQLESRNSQLTISFVLLTEQQSLLNELFFFINSMQNVNVAFEWSTAIIRIMLIAPEINDINKCQEQIKNYLDRCITSVKISNSDGIFDGWDQYTINAFYKYCKDRYVLPQINNTGNKIELNGVVSHTHAAERKWHLQRALIREKTSYILETEQRRSAQLGSKHLVTTKKVCNIMISYSERDTRQCQRLIHRLVEEKLNVWAEPVRNEQLRDVFSEINKADCIIICISENAYENRFCEEEAKMIFKSIKPILLVKVRNDSLIGWQREMFQEKLLIQLFGSDDHFEMEFSRLLLQIYRLTKLKHPLLCNYEENEALQSLLTIEQRQAKYDERVRTLMRIGHIKEKDMKYLIEQSNNVLKDFDYPEKDPTEECVVFYQSRRKLLDKTDESLLENIKRWLGKPTNTTKQNLPPFSVSGDINDAPFPMPQYITKCLNIENELMPSIQCHSPKLRHIFESDIFPRPVKDLSPRTLFNSVLVDKETIYGDCNKKNQILDASRSPHPQNQHNDYSSSQKRAMLPFIPSEVLLTNENALRKCPNFRIKTRKSLRQDKHETKRKNNELAYRTKNIRATLTPDMLDLYRKKFAERMQKNIAEFEAFCLTAESIPQMKKRR